MIEVIGGVLLISFVLCWLLTGLYIGFIWRRQVHSPQRKILNENLKKIGLFWSGKKDDFIPLERGSVERDDAGFVRSLLIITAILSLLSFLGLLAHIIFLVSVGYMARSRKESETFASLLASDASLAPDQIQLIVGQINAN